MEQVFSYINQMGASVMMPILFTIIGLCIGLKFGKSLKSGLYVGIGFVGLGIVTGLLTANFPEPINKFSKVFGLTLDVFDMGWPAASAVAYNTLVGALIIPVCLGVNFLMLITKTTRTVNIDLWNYWHFAFIGAVAYFVMGHSLAWGYFAAIVCYINTLVMADLTAEKFQSYYSDLKGISIPQPFCQSFTPFAVAINGLLDKIPGFSKLDIDAEGLKKKFGVLGEPLVLGVIVGALIAVLSHINDYADMEAYRQAFEAKQQGKGILTAVTMTDAWVSIVKDILFLGVTMGAVMELIPRITKLFIDGLMPISDKTREMVSKKFKGKTIHIGMSPALVIGHPTTLVVSVLLIPVILVIAVLAPGNQFLPVASLAGIFYLFPMILPYTKGNVVKTFIIGLVAMTIGLFFVTDMAPAFTSAANDVFKTTGDPSSNIPFMDNGKQYFAGALDFASSLFGWVIYKCVNNLKWVGMGVLTVFTLMMMYINRRHIIKDEKQLKQQ
ncbi:MAG: PTS sugar transporter subunit IIC [Bacteroidaceae bacterium]|nr:PTS sugar transporter subunit IIC [Bacteroidaceae bacterium]